MLDALFAGLRAKDRRALARLITLAARGEIRLRGPRCRCGAPARGRLPALETQPALAGRLRGFSARPGGAARAPRRSCGARDPGHRAPPPQRHAVRWLPARGTRRRGRKGDTTSCSFPSPTESRPAHRSMRSSPMDLPAHARIPMPPPTGRRVSPWVRMAHSTSRMTKRAVSGRWSTKGRNPRAFLSSE